MSELTDRMVDDMLHGKVPARELVRAALREVPVARSSTRCAVCAHAAKFAYVAVPHRFQGEVHG